MANAGLGAVYGQQKRYRKALEIYCEAREVFETLGELEQVAGIWHEMGIIYYSAGQSEAAEQAYRQALAILVRQNNLSDQATILNSLGVLYADMGQTEEATNFFRQAAEIAVQLKDLASEGVKRSNLAATLIELRRYDEARQESRRAIECLSPYGHAAESWKAWSILEDLERATGRVEAAQAAHQQAIETYLTYRRAGGVSQHTYGQIFTLVAEAIQENAEDEALRTLDQLATQPDTPPDLIPRLQAILGGDRAPSLSADPELHYGSAAELQLLLEALTQNNPERDKAG